MSYQYRNRGMASLGAVAAPYYVNVYRATSRCIAGAPYKSFGPYPKSTAEHNKSKLAGTYPKRDANGACAFILVVSPKAAVAPEKKSSVSTAATPALVAPRQVLIAPRAGATPPPENFDTGGGSSGGGGSLPGAEVDEVVMTPQGPAPLVAQPSASPFPTSTALLVGGGLLAAYLLFGRKRA